MLSLQQDGSYKEMLIWYDINQEEIDLLQNNIEVDLANKVYYHPLESGTFSNDLNLRTYYNGDCEVTTYWVETTIPCPGSPGSHGSNNAMTCSFPYPNGAQTSYNMVTSMSCPTNNGGGGPNTGNTGTPDAGNQGSGSNTTNNDYTTPVDCKPDDPNCLDDDDFGVNKTPCQQLQEVSNNSSKLTKLNNLKNNTGLNKEVGFTRTNNIIGSPNSTVEYQDLIWNPILNQLSINTLTGQQYSDYGHTHYDLDTQLSVFSLSDIHTIYNLLQGNNISSIEFNVFLVTEHGTKYALKFKDLQGAQDFVNFGNIWFVDWGLNSGDYDSQQIKIEKIYKKDYKIKPRKTVNNHKNEMNLARFLNDYNIGIDLYKSNDDFSQWEKINPDGTKTPC